jgi:hypothetical protein
MRVSPDCWQILGIARTDDPKEIRSAYLKQAKRCHPDTEVVEELKHLKALQFIRVQDAYERALQQTDDQTAPAAGAPGRANQDWHHQNPAFDSAAADWVNTLSEWPFRSILQTYLILLVGSWTCAWILPEEHWMRWPLAFTQGMCEGLLLSLLGLGVGSWVLGLVFLVMRLVLPAAHVFKGCYLLFWVLTLWGFIWVTPEVGWSWGNAIGLYQFNVAATSLLLVPLLPAVLALHLRLQYQRIRHRL